MRPKSLEHKLAALRADSDARVFILADAKDADMAFGIGAPGRSPQSETTELPYRSLAEFREIIREIVRQELVDIMLMSASMSDTLTIRDRIFDGSAVTPAVRANDTTDIHAVRGGKYVHYPSMPFRTATVDHIQCGHIDCKPEERYTGVNLGLYSVTFNNEPERDRRTLEEYTRFRIEAERKGFRHFLEVFDPNVPDAVAAQDLPRFINDMIARCLAGVPESGRPLFLKMVYHGPRALEELHHYDPSLVIGILGGSAGTTYDAFKLIAEAQKYGAKVALFGRKINNAENQFLFIRFLRLIVDGQVTPEEAVRAYHAALDRLGVRPHRPLADDMQLQTGVMSYGGSSRTIVTLPARDESVMSVSRPVRYEGGEALVEGRESKFAQATPGVSQECACAHTDSPRSSRSEGCAVTSERSGAGDSELARSTYTPRRPDKAPDFSKMTAAEKLAYHRAERDRIFG